MKQPCVSNQFISINDKVEMDARVLYQTNDEGEESKTSERQKERDCERQSIAGNEG